MAVPTNSAQQNSRSEMNFSNTQAYSPSEPLGRTEINVPATTTQAFVSIIYEKKENLFGKFYNTIIKNLGIMKAFAHGEFFGMANENTIKTIEGFWSPYHGMGVLSFDTTEEAMRFCQANTEVRDHLWCGGVEIYITPLCMPPKSIYDYKYYQMDLYDVKNTSNFKNYCLTLQQLITQNDGLLIVGTQEVMRMRGMRRPKFIMVIQWRNPQNFYNFNQSAHQLLRDAGAACSSKVIFEMELAGDKWGYNVW